MKPNSELFASGGAFCMQWDPSGGLRRALRGRLQRGLFGRGGLGPFLSDTISCLEFPKFSKFQYL